MSVWPSGLRNHVARCLASVIDVDLDRPATDIERRLAAPRISAGAEVHEEAAVLLGLVDRPAGWTVLLTERSEHMRHHAGQVALPGGRRAEADESPVATALREAREEVGLRADTVSVAGRMRAYRTVTGFRVVPVVGFIAREFASHPDPAEVAEVFEVPLAQVLVSGAFKVVPRERAGMHFTSHEMAFDGHRIWGATAAILLEFIEVICEKTEG